MSERIAIYARFSSDLQNPRSASDQIEALRGDLARRYPAWRIVVEERDEAVSGTSMDGRDGLKRLLSAAEQKPRPFDAVVVEDLSRLARNRADSIRLRERFAACDVRILSAADGYVDPESEGGLFLTGIRELKAEADSKETGRRVLRGVRARTLQGWLSGRRAPFGYRRTAVFSATEVDRDGRPKRLGVRLEVDPLTGPIVTDIFRRYASGVGLHRIAQELNVADSPARGAKPQGYASSFIRALLLNPTYRGSAVYARTKERKVRVAGEVKRRKVKNDPAEWAIARNCHPALIDEDTWAKVAARFSARTGLAPRDAAARTERGRRPASLLSGLVKCGRCGGSFVVWTSGPNTKQRARGNRQSTRRFVCSRRVQSGSNMCGNRVSIEVRDLEVRVLDALESQVLTASGLAYLAERRREYLYEAAKEFTKQEPSLAKELREVQAAERNLLRAIVGGIEVSGIREEAEGLAKRRREIEGVLRRTDSLKALDPSEVDAHLNQARLRHFREILELPDLEEIRSALREVILRVEIEEDGGMFLLMGDGPLDPLPPGLSDLNPPSPAQDRAMATGEPTDGRLPESRISVVGATGFEPATS